MAEHQFRLVALVRESHLGKVLAELQLIGSLIEACNVVAPEPRPNDVPKSLPKKPALKSAIQKGISQRARDLLGAFKQGNIIRSAEITAQLRAEGFKASSASSVVATGLRFSRRFQMTEPGVYQVVDSDQPVALYKTHYKRKETHG